MYSNIKSCVIINDKVSDYFRSYSGVRQGENLSPILFSIYLNDLESFLSTGGCDGVTINSPDDANIALFLQLFTLLYADDTALFGETPQKLQTSINVFSDYCKLWKLNVNLSKTKVLVFGGGPAATSKLTFTYDQHKIEIAHSYVYLGIRLHRNR